MPTGRVEAFSDAVIAILMTIMVLELRPPHGTGVAGLRPMIPTVLAYVLSFVYLGIYWNNHHHFFCLVERVNGRILWANLHLLFWLSLVPFTTAWMGEHHRSPLPVAVYGGVLLAAAVAWVILQSLIVAHHGRDSRFASAIGRDAKGKLSPLLYLSAIALAFVSTWASLAIYLFVAMMWFVPDKRIEAAIEAR